jgi:hypothetical protein
MADPSGRPTGTPTLAVVFITLQVSVPVLGLSVGDFSNNPGAYIAAADTLASLLLLPGGDVSIFNISAYFTTTNKYRVLGTDGVVISYDLKFPIRRFGFSDPQMAYDDISARLKYLQISGLFAKELTSMLLECKSCLAFSSNSIKVLPITITWTTNLGAPSLSPSRVYQPSPKPFTISSLSSTATNGLPLWETLIIVFGLLILITVGVWLFVIVLKKKRDAKDKTKSSVGQGPLVDVNDIGVDIADIYPNSFDNIYSRESNIDRSHLNGFQSFVQFSDTIPVRASGVYRPLPPASLSRSPSLASASILGSPSETSTLQNRPSPASIRDPLRIDELTSSGKMHKRQREMRYKGKDTFANSYSNFDSISNSHSRLSSPNITVSRASPIKGSRRSQQGSPLIFESSLESKDPDMGLGSPKSIALMDKASALGSPGDSIDSSRLNIL